MGGEGAGEGRAGLGLRGEGAGRRRRREAGVGQRQAQGVEVPDEARVDDGDAVTGRYGGEERGGLARVRGGADLEAQRPQIALERRSGYRRTGEDGGRQTNSLLGT